MAGFGGAVKLTGETEYKRALKQITDNLTVLSSEMKVVNSMYDKNDASTDRLAKNNEVLNKKLEEQNKSLAEAKKMLDQAKNSTEANATTIAKWQNEVNKAQAEVNNTTKKLQDNTETIKKNEKALDDINDELDEFTQGEEDAGKSAIKLGDLIKANVISDFIVGGIKALGSAMVEIGRKAVDLGKQAIESYANYEQLIGGVETLFKDSSGIVENYANNAYKTAGLSANEYMETVTSFSASLLQSLNGDTKKTAEISDMAITDMSDNANKMGTSMEMIQNAYQGFAKQNYTMLDNLKLGYGGTKGEMERLLADAMAISGVEYDINSLNDVYTAIHIIQENLGIAGTTTKEASTTIQGSISSMQSAWSNLLTGIADEDADFSGLINNFVDSVLTVGDNLLPRIQQTITGMGELASGLLTALVPEIINVIPPLIESTLPTLITAVQSAITSIVGVLPQLTQAVENIIPVLLNAIITMLPSIIEAGIDIILSLVDGITASLPTLIPAVVDAIITIVTSLLDNLDMIVEAGINLIIGLGQGLINAIPLLISRMPQIISSLINALTTALPRFMTMGWTILGELVKGIIQSIPELIKAGGQMLEGLFKGLLDPTAIWNAIKGLYNSIVGGIQSLFGIHSPSTVFEDKIGKNLALGIGTGFESTMSGVTDQMANAIPTNFDINANVTSVTGSSTNMFANMVDAFKEALKEVNIVLDDEVAGRFVTDTVERVVYN